MALDAARPGLLSRWAFVAVMLALTGLFVALGMWQVQRLGEKEAQIATVAARAGLAPVDLPAPAAWSDLDPESFDFRPVRVSGAYRHEATVLVFDNLTDARGTRQGAGYWVMAPLVVEGEGVVWINRGFVPQDLAEDFAAGGPDPEAEAALEGLARRPERANLFTPAPDLAERRDWVRDPERLAAVLAPGTPVAPLYIDLPAGPQGALPQGGETEMVFSNRHLEYAGTWFAFALITPVMLGFWLWRQRR